MYLSIIEKFFVHAGKISFILPFQEEMLLRNSSELGKYLMKQNSFYLSVREVTGSYNITSRNVVESSLSFIGVP